MKKMLFVVNPYAGKRKITRYLSEVIGIFNRADYDVTTYMTAGPGDAIGYVEDRAKDMDLIVCAGGDGTFNEMVAGLLKSECDVPVGYIPCGSTNDFANSLHIPTNVIKAAQAIAEGQPHKIDIGLFGQRHFCYVASFGLFTKVSYATPQGLKNVMGHMAYVLSGVSEISQIRKHKEHIRLELDDGEIIEDDFIFGQISNSTSVGGVLTLDPKIVDMSDGLFEVLLIRVPKNMLEVGECISALKKQTYDSRMIVFLSAKKVKVYAPEEMPWTLDGEKEEGHEKIKVKNLHHAVKLMLKQ